MDLVQLDILNDVRGLGDVRGDVRDVENREPAAVVGDGKNLRSVYDDSKTEEADSHFDMPYARRPGDIAFKDIAREYFRDERERVLVTFEEYVGLEKDRGSVDRRLEGVAEKLHGAGLGYLRYSHEFGQTNNRIYSFYRALYLSRLLGFNLLTADEIVGHLLSISTVVKSKKEIEFSYNVAASGDDGAKTKPASRYTGQGVLRERDVDVIYMGNRDGMSKDLKDLYSVDQCALDPRMAVSKPPLVWGPFFRGEKTCTGKRNVWAGIVFTLTNAADRSVMIDRKFLELYAMVPMRPLYHVLARLTMHYMARQLTGAESTAEHIPFNGVQWRRGDYTAWCHTDPNWDAYQTKSGLRFNCLVSAETLARAMAKIADDSGVRLFYMSTNAFEAEISHLRVEAAKYNVSIFATPSLAELSAHVASMPTLGPDDLDSPDADRAFVPKGLPLQTSFPHIIVDEFILANAEHVLLNWHSTVSGNVEIMRTVYFLKKSLYVRTNENFEDPFPTSKYFLPYHSLSGGVPTYNTWMTS